MNKKKNGLNWGPYRNKDNEIYTAAQRVSNSPEG